MQQQKKLKFNEISFRKYNLINKNVYLFYISCIIFIHNLNISIQAECNQHKQFFSN